MSSQCFLVKFIPKRLELGGEIFVFFCFFGKNRYYVWGCAAPWV